MIRKRWSILALTSAALFLLIPHTASAHVLLSDTNDRTGAVLHITPDDDPIAGETTELFFDIKDKRVSNQAYAFQLTITSEHSRDIVPITLGGSGVGAQYIFPVQGLYRIELTAQPGVAGLEALRFTHTQRVSRGVNGTEAKGISHTWAEIGLIASVISLLMLGIVMYNRRGSLAEYVKHHR